MNGTMMSNFLQRMLKRNDDESDVERAESDKRRIGETSSTGKKRLGLCSTRKSDAMATTRSQPCPINARPGENRRDYRGKNVSGAGTPRSDELPSIERIRREFEMGFRSPSKHEAKDAKSGRFVKKLVAAFEEKYNNFKDIKVEEKRNSVELDSSDEGSRFSDERSAVDEMEDSMAILGDTCVIESLESRLSRYLDSYVATGALTSSRDEVDSSAKLGNKLVTRETSNDDDDDDVGTSDEMIEKSCCTPKSSSGRQLVRRDSSIKRERKPKIVGAYLKKPIEVEDTSIDWIPIIGKKLPRKRSFKRLLSILTGKKWSSGRSSKLYCSDINLTEETTRELLQDSGYEEKSGSSSSLTSLASINDLIVQQRNHRAGESAEDDRRSYVMTTFGRPMSEPIFESNDSNDRDYEFETMTDEIFETWSDTSRRITFEDVARSDVRLSLGPAFPAAPNKIVTSSLDRRDDNLDSLSEQEEEYEDLVFVDDDDDDDDENLYEEIPLASPLPKHPFVSLKKKSKRTGSVATSKDSSSCNESLPRSDSDTTMTEKLDLSLRHTWKFPSDESIHYDVPRRYFSKSDPGLAMTRNADNPGVEHVYDVPKATVARRPRSSIYEDALSLKRRNDNFEFFNPAPTSSEFYGLSAETEPHYATVKPLSLTRINPYPGFVRATSYFGSTESSHRF